MSILFIEYSKVVNFQLIVLFRRSVLNDKEFLHVFVQKSVDFEMFT